NPIAAIENLTATTLRNIIGELDLDETLTSRDIINVKMRTILDEATDKWGIKVNRVVLIFTFIISLDVNVSSKSSSPIIFLSVVAVKFS
ncbi:SPFH domain-containing protein, partial [Clostridioides difficile]|uniref:SPFH domain-containing protein n=1 Tax=Clostridioides difficile TaxID=1496 RepID=UPI00234FB6DA